MAKTYNIGPKLGDFINGLIVPKYIYETTGEKAIILISNEACRFTTTLISTFKELRPIIKKQDFVQEFRIYKSGPADYELFRFRQSPKLFSVGWTELYFNMYLPGKEIPSNYQWLSLPINANDNILINRTLRPMSNETYQYYDKFLTENKAKFICSDKKQYEGFPLKNKVELLHTPTLEGMFNNIAACKLFLGNQSAPLAIASAFNINRIGELRKNEDAAHYGKETHYSNLQTFVGD